MGSPGDLTGAITVLRARHVALDTDVDRNPIDAWDLEAIAQHDESFVRRWSPLLPGIAENFPIAEICYPERNPRHEPRAHRYPATVSRDRQEVPAEKVLPTDGRRVSCGFFWHLSVRAACRGVIEIEVGECSLPLSLKAWERSRNMLDTVVKLPERHSALSPDGERPMQ